MKIIKNGLALIFVVLVSSGCDYLPTAENKAKKAVAASLVDPESARFEYVIRGAKEGDYCGAVNGKNRMGGYAGASPFVYQASIDLVEIGTKAPEDDDFESFYRLGGQSSDKYIELVRGCKFPGVWKTVCGHELPVKISDLCSYMVDKSPAEFVSELRRRF